MTWVDLSSSFAYGTKLTSANMQQLRDNIAAAFAKDPGSPELAADYIQTAMLADSQVTLNKLSTDSIGIDNLQHGTLMLPLSGGSGSSNSAAYAAVITYTERVYIPTNATFVTMTCQVQATTPYTAYARFSIGSSHSSGVSTASTSYVWLSTATLDVSALGGWYVLTVDTYPSNTNGTSYVRYPSFIWE